MSAFGISVIGEKLWKGVIFDTLEYSRMISIPDGSEFAGGNCGNAEECSVQR